MMPQDARPPVPGPLVGGPRPMAVRGRPGVSRRRLFGHRVAAPVAAGLAAALWSTYRLRVEGAAVIDELLAAGGPAVLTLWHDGAFLVAPCLRRLALRGLEVTYLVSPSVDGDLVTRIVERLGGRVSRGSATRSGVQAMRGLYREIVRRGASPLLLPDGPHGPAHVCKSGSILLARLSGAAVLPIGCAMSRGWRLKTWDRLRIPYPGARVHVVLGEPYTLPRELDDDLIEQDRQALEATLGDLERRAAVAAGRS